MVLITSLNLNCIAFYHSLSFKHYVKHVSIILSSIQSNEIVEKEKEIADKSSHSTTGAWFPILSKSASEISLPIQIEVAGQRLVAWNEPKSQEWIVMKDFCPHRLAPLSQGRIDPNTGFLNIFII